MTFKLSIMLTILFSTMNIAVFGQLTLDSSFAGDGIINANPHTGGNQRGIVSAIEWLPDGKYLVAGSAEGILTATTVITVQKFNADGSKDTSFGNVGVVAFVVNSLESVANAMAIQPDGRIIVAGFSRIEGGSRVPRETILRLNTNGTLDNTFSGDGFFVQPEDKEINMDLGTVAYDVEVLPDGSIVTSGQFLLGSQNTNNCGDGDTQRRCSSMALYSSSGAPVSRKFFDLSPIDDREFISDIEVQPDGKIVAAVSTELDNEFIVARFNSDAATLDTSFGINGIVRETDFFGRTRILVSNVKIDSQGRILATGRTATISNGNGLITARFLANGTLDNSYGTGGKTPVVAPLTGRNVAGNDAIIQPDGKILANGTFGTFVRFNSDGTLDSTFGVGGVFTNQDIRYPFKMVREPNGKVAFAARTTLVGVGGGQTDNWVVGRLRPIESNFDFDGDSKTDVSIFRPNVGEWWYLRSSDSDNRALQFGSSTDIPVPADFTGDGKTDITFWRNGEWFILRSEDDSFFSFPFGTTGDIPAPGDFDGDGKADPTVFRPSQGVWFVSKTTGGTDIIPFGIAEDKPVVADYDGDGKDDIAIFRPSVSEWWINRSQAGLTVAQFGSAGDKAVQGDYTGDGKADVAFFRPSNGEWFIIRSEDNSFFSFPFGTNGDIAAPGDYDGDGTFDTAVFRPSSNTWFINGTTSGVQIVGFGTNGDIPLPSVFTP